MTDEELTGIEVVIYSGHATHDEITSLLHLARRGLRAEREVCGWCRYWYDGLDERSQGSDCTAHNLRHPGASESCSRWRAKGGG